MKTPIALLLAVLMFAPVLPAGAQEDGEPDSSSGAPAAAGEEGVEFSLSDFNGRWVLNPELSQDLAVVLREAMGPPAGGRGRGAGGGTGRRGGGGMGGGLGGGRAGGGRGRGGGETFGDSERAPQSNPLRQQRLRVQKEYSHLEIYVEFPELNLTNGLDIMQLFFLDGRETSIWTDRGEVSARSELKDGRLHVATTGHDPGSTRDQTYGLTDDARQLVLEEERLLPGQEEPITIRMVYDRALAADDGD